jgi:hypothetical protein
MEKSNAEDEDEARCGEALQEVGERQAEALARCMLPLYFNSLKACLKRGV